MRQYKESEWRDEVEYVKKQSRPCPFIPVDVLYIRDCINLSTTRGAVLYFHFSLPAEYQTQRLYIMEARKRLKTIRKERRKRVIDKIHQWRKSITTKIYGWLLKREYKRITNQRPKQITQ